MELNLSNVPGLSEKELIKLYASQTRIILLEKVKCSTKENRTIGGTRNSFLYPNRIQTFIANIGSYGFEFGFDREFMNVSFNDDVLDLGVFCEVVAIKDLKKLSGYEKARYKNVIVCDTARIERRTSFYRLAEFDSKSCNFALSQL